MAFDKKEYLKEYYRANRETIDATTKLWQQNNHERYTQMMRKHYQKKKWKKELDLMIDQLRSDMHTRINEIWKKL